MLDSNDFLIEPDALVKLIGGNVVIVDARRPELFKTGHIPGAVPFSTYGLLAEDTSLDGMKRFAETIANRFMIAGVTLDRPVVVYDDDTGMYAARERRRSRLTRMRLRYLLAPDRFRDRA